MVTQIHKKSIQIKNYLKAIAGLIVFITISMNLEAATFLKSENNKSQAEVLEPSEQMSTKKEPHDAKTLYDLSILAANRNDLTLARNLIDEAIRLNHSNLDYLAFATDIAFIEKKYDKAEEYQVMLLLVAQSTLGLSTLLVSDILDQLAAINIVQERYEQARFRLQESLQLREKILGNNHLLIISSLNKLALLATRQQHPTVAEPLLKRSLDIARKVSGRQHGNSAILLASLADFYQNEGRLEEAEVHYKEAISIWETLPSDTPDRMLSQNSLGKLLLGQQRFDDARLQFEQVLHLLKQHYKKDHPYVQQAIENIKILDAEHKINLEKKLMYNELIRMLSFQLSQYRSDNLPSHRSQ